MASSLCCKPVGSQARLVRAAAPFRVTMPALRCKVRQMATATEVGAKPEAKVDGSEPKVVDDYAPTTQQVQSLLSVLCEQTDIAELHLQAGGFELKVRRNTQGGASASPAFAAPAASAAAVVHEELAASPLPIAAGGEALETVDESLIYVPSPKVGIFRRGKYAGGKRVGKGNAVDEFTKVKKGQALGYVEQLGTYVTCEAPQAGEIVKFLVADGAAVEYGQTIAELAPYFGGHIIGDKKYA